MKDREIAYWQNVDGLKIAYANRIADWSRAAVLVEDDDVYAAEIVTARLLKSERWANVAAVDISDIAYDACVAARRPA